MGALAAEKIAQYLGATLSLTLKNTETSTLGALNNSCGADYVKTSQKAPPSLSGSLQPGQRACSLDGDADRLIYYYLDERGQFHLLDGDKIAALVAAFIVELVELAGLQGQIDVGVVQTAYANGSSTKYLSDVSSLLFVVSHFSNYIILEVASSVCIHRRETPPPRRRALLYRRVL